MVLLDQAVPEAIPAPGVWHSYNGRVLLGGYEIFRVSEAMFLISNGANTYYEIGSRYGIPYRGATLVSYSFRRAFVNLYETVLAIGRQPTSKFIPGRAYTGADLIGKDELMNIIDSEMKSGKRIGAYNSGPYTPTSSPFDRPSNHYPIKTTCQFIVNPDGVHSDANDDFSNAYEQQLTIYGVMLDVLQLNIGGGGELITLSPIEGIAEQSKIEVIPSSTGWSAPAPVSSP